MSTQPKGALVALKDRREQIIEQLCEQFSKDALEVESFEERIDKAHQATSLMELDALVADLVPAPAAGTALAVRPSVALSTRADHPRSTTVFSILGGSERNGTWRVPKTVRSVVCLGGTTLDLREAIFAPGVTEIHVYCIMGGCHILVPPALPVECHGTGIMGGFHSLERHALDPDPEAPFLRVRGFVIAGGVSVETRLVGESERDAKKRRRHERRTASKRLQAKLPE